MRALRRVWVEGQGWELDASNNLACGTGRRPTTARLLLIRRRSRRKRDCAPRLMARKSSEAERAKRGQPDGRPPPGT